jgi:hypothetical protein
LTKADGGFRTLPAAQQIEEVRKELEKRNPGFDGLVRHGIEGGVVAQMISMKACRSGWRSSAWPPSSRSSPNARRRSSSVDGRVGWYVIRQGIRGLLVPDERGCMVANVICEPASHYYRVMTGSDRMPVLIDERI